MDLNSNRQAGCLMYQANLFAIWSDDIYPNSLIKKKPNSGELPKKSDLKKANSADLNSFEAKPTAGIKPLQSYESALNNESF